MGVVTDHWWVTCLKGCRTIGALSQMRRHENAVSTRSDRRMDEYELPCSKTTAHMVNNKVVRRNGSQQAYGSKYIERQNDD
jgi:hypothetical protein